MSRFIDKLNGLSKTAVSAMGFHRPVAQEKSASMLLIAEASGKQEDEMKALADLGVACAILESAGLSASALSKYLKAKGDMIMGLAMASAKGGNGLKLVTGDIDFIVFDAGMPASAFEGADMEAVGKVLRVTTGIEANLLRAVRGLQPAIDAVIIDLRVPALTVEHLMNCRRVSEISGLLTLALVGTSLSVAELTSLRGAGVKGLVPGPNAATEDLGTMIRDISALPKPEKRNESKTFPLVPRQEAHPVQPDEGGDGDHDNDDDGDE